MRKSLLIALCAAAIPIAAPQLDAQSSREEWLDNCRRMGGRSDRVRHCEVRDLTAAVSRRLDIYAGRNGGMSVHGATDNRLTIEARIQTQASTIEEAQAHARSLSFTTQDGVIRVEDPDADGHASVIFVVNTPRRTDVVARAENGPVVLAGLEGEIRAEVRNGPLSLRDLAGDVHARTINGPLSVSLSGSRWDGRGLDAAAQNGPITLQLPTSYSAELTAGTVNGPLVSDLPVAITGSRGERQLIQTRLGNGGAPISVTSVNGPAVIRVGARRSSSRH